MSFLQRLAGAPISWGVCEVPGWGHELPRDRVLGEMQELGLRATELGSDGYLPTEPAALKALCDEYDLTMIGGFVPVVIHDPAEREATIEATHRAASLMANAGGTLFISAAVTDWGWGPRRELDDDAWRYAGEMLARIDEIIADYGMTQALHPHLRTIVETAADVEHVLSVSDVGWTLDTGHLLIGGCDPLQFVRDHRDRIRHVHLKDVHLGIAGPVLAGDRSIMEGVQDGMFCNLGDGDVAIAEIVREFERGPYDGWYVLEQDAAITGDLPPAGSGPIVDVAASIDFLRSVDIGAAAAN